MVNAFHTHYVLRLPHACVLRVYAIPVVSTRAAEGGLLILHMLPFNATRYFTTV